MGCGVECTSQKTIDVSVIGGRIYLKFKIVTRRVG